MATDLEKLIVSLEARTKQFQSELKAANALARRELKGLQKQFDDTNKKLVIKQPRMSGGGMGFIGAGGLAAGAALAANEVRRYADAWTEASNKIAAAQQISGKQARSLEALNDISTKTRSGLTETVDLYTKLMRATKDVAKSEDEVAKATEIVNKSFKAGGASASEQAAGILQLSQALGSGVLQGDELRSLRENAPLLAQAIAKEFGTTVAGLKELGAEGKLTTDRIFKGILAAGPAIDATFAKTKATIGDNFTLLQNAATQAVGKLSDLTGAGQAAGERLAETASIINGLSDALIAVSGSPAGKFLGFLTDTINKLEPIQAALRMLADERVQAGLGAGAASLAGDGNDAAGRIEDATRALNEFFAARRQGGAEGFLTKQQAAGFDKLQDEMKAATISLADAKKRVEELVNMDPGTSPQIIDTFDLIIDKLTEVTTAAKTAAGAVAFVSQDERGQMLASRRSDSAYSSLISKEQADAARSAYEKQVDTKAKELIAAAAKIGVAMTEAAAKIEATKIVSIENKARISDSAVGSYVDQVVGAESGGKKNAKNPLSSATGLGQFIESTWLDLFRKNFPDRAANMSKEAILALRTDGDISRRLIEAYARENSAILEKAGVSVDAAALHLAHFLGPQGAIKVLTAAAGTPIAGLLDPGAIAANKSILGNGATVDSVRAYAERRAGQSTTRTAALDGQDAQLKSVEDVQKRIAAIKAETAAMAGLNPYVKDYGYAVEKARILQELLNDAQTNSVEVTPQLKASYEELAGQLAMVQVAQEKTAESQQYLNDKLADASNFGKDVLGGFLRDLRDGKSLAESLAGALDKVADKFLDMALNGLFDGFGANAKPGGGLLGGIFGSLFHMFGFAKGGIAKNGQPMPTFAKGGISKTAAVFGEGRMAEAAVPLPDGKSIPVSFSAPPVPAGDRGSGNTHVTVGVTVDKDGTLQPYVQSVVERGIRKAAPGIVGASVKTVKGQMGNLMSEAQARQA